MASQRREVDGRGRAVGLHRIGVTLLMAGIVGLAVDPDGPMAATDEALRLPQEIQTERDGRKPILELFAAHLELTQRGWQLDVVAYSKPPGTSEELPIIALRTPRPGPAIWILSGIHGEEPAGPNAVAAAIDDLAALAESVPVVLLPLCNPHGYARNWRYLNMPVYSATVEGQSVGDSSHLLPDPRDPTRARAAAASSPEADALTRYVVQLAETYPPLVSIDLHEDDLIAEGYVYCQGEFGCDDRLAHHAVAVLRDNGIPIKLEGQTRFGEEIVGGIVVPVTDSSIDELIGTREILVDGRSHTKPAARTTLTFETPGKDATLARRVAAHLALLRSLADIITPQSGRERP
jgi:hypothetical protein